MLKSWRVYPLLFVILFLAIGCRQADVTPTRISEQFATSKPTKTATIRPSSTPSPLPTNTPTPTLTPSPTPTPTATAVSIQINNAIAKVGDEDPVPVGGAPCGVIDTLDFPIDPPLALNVSRGGQDFGVFRSRYGKYHAGEDWGAPSGRRNLGEPVYSIGHGRIMYAHPNGWGRDKGVVIVEHVLLDGNRVYSFYGHLDPPSVVLNSGECVQRGDQIGNIGDPRTPPHLHFEMRTHMPYQPGPGYWSDDPTTAGWIAPSQTIWQQRMLAAPNVQWIRPYSTNQHPIGKLNDNTYLFLEDRQILSIDLNNSSESPSILSQDDIADALVLLEFSTIYTVNFQGKLTKYSQTDESDIEDRSLPIEFVTEWDVELDKRGRPTLQMASDGDVIVMIQDELFYVNKNGEQLWQFEIGERPSYWANSAEQTLFTTDTPPATWRIRGDTVPEQMTDVSGIVIDSGISLWVYAQNEIVQIEEDTAVSRYTLPNGFLQRGDALPLTDGGLLVSNMDIFDQRLLAFAEDGSLRWERSFATLFPNDVQLIMSDGHPYLVTIKSTSLTTILNIYAIDLQTAVLTHIFSGGTRTDFSNNNWVVPTEDGNFIINLNDSLIHLATQ